MKPRITAVALVVAVFLFLSPSQVSAGDSCQPDLNGDGVVGAADLAILLGNWGPNPGHPADFNGDDIVGAADLAQLLGSWGPCVFDYNDYEDAEAEEIALETLGPAGPLQPPDEIYSRCDQDLDLIRAAEPALISEIHRMAWNPTKMFVNINEEADQTEYLALNAYYQVTAIVPLGSSYVLHFPGKLNTSVLAQIYEALPAVNNASIVNNGSVDNVWVPTDLGAGTWQWDIDVGSCDCLAGCWCHFFYVFETDAKGSVELLSVEEDPPGCHTPGCD